MLAYQILWNHRSGLQDRQRYHVRPSNNTKITTEAGCALCSENLQQISANLVPSAATDLRSSREQLLVWIFQ